MAGDRKDREKKKSRGASIRPVVLKLSQLAEEEPVQVEEAAIPPLRPRKLDPPLSPDPRPPAPPARQMPVRRTLPVRRDIPLIYKSLEEAVEGCRDKHPLPVELISNQDASHSTWLLSQLRGVRTRSELQGFADSLGSRDLGLLFTTLTGLKRREETAQIQNLIRLRASHYLYLCGWLTLQYTYPRASVSDALADLCMILEDIRFVRDNERLVGRRTIRPLPAVPLGPGRVVWSRVPLISGIALPNSRHFISDIAGEIYDSKVDLQDFYLEYALFPDLPLAEAITARYNEMVSGVSANPLLSHDFFDRFRKN